MEKKWGGGDIYTPQCAAQRMLQGQEEKRVNKEGNGSYGTEVAREDQAKGLGVQKCYGKFPEGPGPTHSLVGRMPKAQGPERPQMLATFLNFCGCLLGLPLWPLQVLGSRTFHPT